MALEKMEYMVAHGEWYEPEQAITALRQALDQPKQEPVAWHYQSRLGNDYLTDVKAEPSPDWHETPLYTALQQCAASLTANNLNRN